MGHLQQMTLLAVAILVAAATKTAVAQEAHSLSPDSAALALPASASLGEERTSGEADAPQQPAIAVGFDTVAGAPRYAIRTSTESGISSIAFSATRPRAAGSGDAPFGLPVASARLTSGYGARVHPVTGQWSSHRGVDLAVATGTPVAATAAGRVVVAGWAGNYGLLVSIDHGGGMQTFYGHLSSVAVRPGSLVAAGQVIGLSGSTGRTTGPHVHYEVRVDGSAVNPMAVASR